MSKSYLRHLGRDLLIFIGSVFVAILLAQLGVIEKFVALTASAPAAASFIAGMFFTSVLTIAPASVALVALARDIAPLDIAFWGGIGATCVDLVLFSFMRYNLSKDASGILKPSFRRRVVSLFHFGFMKWIVMGAGAFIIASPFPDEIGLAFLSLARIKPQHLIILTFVMNFVGIFALTAAARALL